MRSLWFVMVLGLTFIMACSEDEGASPDVSAFFKTNLEAGEPLEAPADVVLINGSKNGLSYVWDFGEGYLKRNPEAHTYVGVSPDTVRFPLPGTYQVKVTATGGANGDEMFTQTFEVKKQTPSITYTPENILVDTTVSFAVSYFLKEGNTATFEWTFEDGEPATSNIENPQVKFKAAGTKQVTLALNDGDETLNVSISLEVKEELAPTLYFTDMNTKRIYKKRLFATEELDNDEPIISTGIVLQDNSLPMTMVVDGNRVYYTNTDNKMGNSTFGEIISFALNGSNKTVVATGGVGQYVPFSIAIDGNDLYWTDRRDGIHKIIKSGVSQAMGDGSWYIKNAESEYTGNGIPWGAQNGTVASYDGKIWWAKNAGGNSIYVMDKSLPKNDAGLVKAEKLMDGLSVRSFFIDKHNTKIYLFINKPMGSTDIGLYVANLDGTDLTLIQKYEPGVDFDETGGALEYLGLTGIAVMGDYVYWGYRDKDNNAATSGVKRAKLDGSEVEMYLPGYVPYGIAIDEVPR